MKNRAHGIPYVPCALPCARVQCMSARGGLAQDLRPWGTDLPVSMGRCDAVLPLCDAVVGRSREGGEGQGHLCQAEAEDGKGREESRRRSLASASRPPPVVSSTQLNSTQLNSPLPSTLTHLATPLGSASATLARRRVTTLLVELALRANEPAPENTGAQKCRLRLACLQVSRWTRRSRDAE